MKIKLYSNTIFQKLTHNINESKRADLLTDYSGRYLSGAQVIEYIDNIAIDLVSHGVQKGDRVIFLSKASIESVLYFFAFIRVGAVIVLVDPEMGHDNFMSRIEFSKAKWILQDKILDKIEKYSFLKPLLRIFNIWFPDNLPIKNRITIKSLKKIGVKYPNEIEEGILSEDGEMIIIFTSGTVSEPKGVVHSYKSLACVLDIITTEIAITKSDFLYASQFYFLLIGLVISAKTYIPINKSFSAERFLKITRDQNITSAFLLPYEGELIYKSCLKRKEKIPSSFKTILFGSAPVTKGFLSRFATICNASQKIYGVYGSTEALPISLIEMNEKLNYRGDGDLLGKPARDVRVEISKDKEILVSGPQLYTKYLGENENAKYFRSGDLGKIDTEGNIILLGRKKDMIIKKGYNIYPALFEASISKITNVTECSMVGIYDDTIEDERVILFVVPAINLPSFQSQLKQSLKSGEYSIDSYAYPDEIILINDMPRSGRSKKIDKNALREIARKKI